MSFRTLFRSTSELAAPAGGRDRLRSLRPGQRVRSPGHRQPQAAVMDITTSPFEAYNEKIAVSDLRRYRTKDPRPWTRTLIEALKAEGVEGATLLDVGGGIGVI